MFQTMAKLKAGYAAIALQIQEAATSDLSANDIRTRLTDAISDQHRGTGQYGYFIDFFGDAESGDVIYCCDGDTFKAPYEMASAAGASKCVVDFENCEDVVPRTIYEPEADEADHYAAMEESLVRETMYTALPLYERFIPKSERDKADAEDFAGKGKSFPILKPDDIMAAVHSMGRAGAGNMGPSGIKARIISIAKRKGWTKYLPKGWQDGSAGSKEARAQNSGEGPLRLCESASTLDVIRLQEAKADYEIKLIAPGKGSTAFYPSEVLKRDGPGVFKAGTHVYLNHATAAEESARPEGDVKNLAGVLTTAAEYHESHAKGPGLYARMKVFADHAQMVEEKAPHVGMSIRAAGVAESGKMRDGVPILKKLTAAQSVDVVTRAGAGGMILQESAMPAQSQQEADGMTVEEAKKLIEAGVTAAMAPVRTRLITADAREEAGRLLDSVTLPAAAKQRIIESVSATPARTEAGELDVVKFRESVVAAAKAEGEYLAAVTGSGRVIGMGVAPVIDPKEAERVAAADKALETGAVQIFESLGMPKDAATLSATKGWAA